jgi:glyoxylase-like metal-dependent hydrolase (beta-lactamase superfamily II)
VRVTLTPARKRSEIVNATPVTDHIIQLTRLHFVNAFLVREDDGFTLIDTTVGGGAQKLIDAAVSAGGQIKRIALTHGHSDHAGSLDALKERLGAVEVFLSDLDARIHAGEKVVDGKLPGSWPKDIKTTPDVRLAGGERIGSLEVIATPGHTPGHMAFRDTRENAVIAGDVYTSYGGLAVTNHFKLRFPLAYPATWDRAKDAESARRLRELEPAVVLVGHGPAVRDPLSAMDRAIAQAGGPTAATGAAAAG